MPYKLILKCEMIYARISKRLHLPTRLPHSFLIHPLLTILCAGPQQVDDVLVFANNLHHFHLGDEVWQVLLCGVGYKSNIHEHTYTWVWHVTKPSASKLWGTHTQRADGWFYLCFPFSFISDVDLKSTLQFATFNLHNLIHISVF